jgi:hypothetical protein
MSFSYGNSSPAAYYSKIEGNLIIFKLNACEKLTLAESLLVPGFGCFACYRNAPGRGLDKD